MRWTITILGCLLVLGTLATYKFLDIRASIAMAEAYPEQSETVEEATVTSADFAPTIAVIGEIVAPQRLDLRNEIAGEITAVNFRSGEPVTAGQLLIQLDTTVEEASLRVAQTRADLARRVQERSRELFESRVSNQDALDRANAELAAAQAEVEVLERTIAKKTLRAPFAGRAGLHTFEVGQYLPSNTLIANLVGDTDYVWVDFSVPQFYTRLALDTEVAIAGIGNGSAAPQAAARIIAENTVLNANSRSRLYRARIAGDPQRYTPHTMVQVEVPTGAPQPYLQVPVTAVLRDPLGQYVFVLREDAASRGWRAQRQQVEVTVLGAEYALIESGRGLALGDKVAAAGAFKLHEGMLVFTRERNGGNEAGRATQGTY